MTWRIGIRHVTGHRYVNEVSSSYNEARITPLSTPRQLCLEAKVEVVPSVRPRRYWDYWGTCVDSFDLHVPHTEMVVTGTSVVETATPERPGRGVGWDTLSNVQVADQHAELLGPTAYTPFDQGLAEVACGIRAASRTPSDAGIAACGWVRDQLDYVRGSTSVRTSGIEAWAAGAGVCQDFAHLTLGVLRAMGIPGRYVSGYLHPFPDAEIGQVITGQSHAWIEWWDGDWRPFDPTNGVYAGERHVIVGRGRDYHDVTPLKGLFKGGPTADLGVEVELTRVG